MALKRFTPEIKALIAESSRICFGNLPIVPYRTGFKLLRQKPIGPMAVHHYLPDFTRTFRDNVPGFRTGLEERRTLMLARAKRRGRVIPKKGQGKRATRAAGKKGGSVEKEK